MEEAEKALQEATEKRDAQFALLGSRMRFLQQKGSSGYLEILFDAQSFSDLFLRMQYVNDIMGYDKEILEELEKPKERLRKRKKRLKRIRLSRKRLLSCKKKSLPSSRKL